MDKIETGQGERVLWNDELDTVSGGGDIFGGLQELASRCISSETSTAKRLTSTTVLIITGDTTKSPS
jgi:hypothetical protein